MSISVDPGAVPQEDKLRFNLLANDIGLEFDGAIGGVSGRLTVGGQQCGERLTTVENLRSPLILEITADLDGYVIASTELLITRGGAYSYAFVGGGKWRACSDCKEHYHVQGALPAGFNSSYGCFEPKEIGPGKIMDSLHALRSSDKGDWEDAFKYLVFMFIESARMIEFGNGVRLSLVDGAQNYSVYNHVRLTPLKLRLLPHQWGHGSDALRGYYLGDPPMTHWLVADAVIDVFRLPLEDEDEGEGEDVEEQEQQPPVQDEEEIIQEEVNLCVANVRIVMHG